MSSASADVIGIGVRSGAAEVTGLAGCLPSASAAPDAIDPTLVACARGDRPWRPHQRQPPQRQPKLRLPMPW